MRYMILLKYGEAGEDAAVPSPEYAAEMGRFNEELTNAGVMVAGEGLHGTSEGARVRITPGGEVTVIDGPFAETKELLAGFWIWQVGSKEEAIEWVKRIPMPPDADAPSEIEVRRVFEDEEFEAELEQARGQRST